MTIEATRPTDVAHDVATVTMPAAELGRALAVSKLGTVNAFRMASTLAVSITVGRDRVELTTFDYTCSTRVHVTADSVTGSGTVAVNHAELADVVKAAGKGFVSLTLTDAGALTVTAGRLTSTLAGVDRAEIPALPEVPDTVHLFTTSLVGLQTAAGDLARSASTDTTTPVLAGVGVTREQSTVTLSTTDRYRMTSVEFAAWAHDDLTSGEFIIPARELLAAARALARFGGKAASVSVWAGNVTPGTTLTIIETAGARVTLSNIDGTFPRVAAIWPDTRHQLTIDDPRAVIDACKALRSAQGRKAAIRAEVGNGRLTLSATSATMSTDVPAVHDAGDDGTVWGFDPRYLADALTPFAGPVTLAWAAPGKPVTFTGEGDVKVLQMPVNLATV